MLCGWAARLTAAIGTDTAVTSASSRTNGNFCMDGLVYPDRTPHTGLFEWKNVARPVRASLKDAAKGTVLVHNYFDFTNLADALIIDFEVTKNGETVQSGSVETPDLAPHGRQRSPSPL